MENQMTQVSLVIPKDLLQRADALVPTRYRSRAEVLRCGLERIVEEERQRQQDDVLAAAYAEMAMADTFSGLDRFAADSLQGTFADEDDEELAALVRPHLP